MVRWKVDRLGHRGRNGYPNIKQKKQKKQKKQTQRPKRGSPGTNERRPMAELVDYVRSCSKALQGLSSSDEAEALLISTRAVEEITSADSLFFVAADQRGSKALEKLMKKATPSTFSTIFTKLLERFSDLATNQYASHVLETALRSWSDRLGRDSQVELQQVSKPIIDVCSQLDEDELWYDFVCNPCSAHVVRALLMALGGYAHEEGKEKLAARAGLLPQTKYTVAADVADCRRRSASSLIKLLKKTKTESLCLNAHASPVIQLLLRLLRDCSDRALLAEACAAVVGAKTVDGSPSVKRCDALLASAAGSRVLEAALETSGAELFAELFSKYFRRRLSVLASSSSSEFGPFIAQKVADGLREAPQLLLALTELEDSGSFLTCLQSSDKSHHMVILKFLEASLRLRAGLKQAAGGVFRALALHASSEYHRAWATLLSLDASVDVASLASSTSSASSEVQEVQGIKGMRLRRLPATGAMLLAMLLRFPAETVAPVTSGLSKMLKQEILVALALESRTARVLEAALAPSSALGARRLKLASAFQGSMAVLGPHPCGGWVCAALWRASLGTKLREAFAKELLEVEEKLRKENFAVWKVCGLHQVKLHHEEWMQQQTKAGKVQALFEDLIVDQESAKAAKMRRARAAEDEALSRAMEDPTVAALLPLPSESPNEVPLPVPSSKKVTQDPSLQEALLLIKGKAPKRRRKRKAEEEEEEA